MQDLKYHIPKIRIFFLIYIDSMHTYNSHSKHERDLNALSFNFLAQAKEVLFSVLDWNGCICPSKFFRSQAAQNHEPLDCKVAHNFLKVAHRYSLHVILNKLIISIILSRFPAVIPRTEEHLALQAHGKFPKVRNDENFCMRRGRH